MITILEIQSPYLASLFSFISKRKAHHFGIALTEKRIRQNNVTLTLFQEGGKGAPIRSPTPRWKCIPHEPRLLLFEGDVPYLKQGLEKIAWLHLVPTQTF